MLVSYLMHEDALAIYKATWESTPATDLHDAVNKVKCVLQSWLISQPIHDAASKVVRHNQSYSNVPTASYSKDMVLTIEKASCLFCLFMF